MVRSTCLPVGALEFQKRGAGAIFVRGSFLQSGGYVTISDSKANHGGAANRWGELDVFSSVLCKRLRSNVAVFCARANRRGLLI